MEKELERLLYRKNIAEDTMEKFAKGVELHNELCNQIQRELVSGNISELEIKRLEVELDKTEWECRVFATNYKSTQREYHHALKPRLSELLKDVDETDVQFIDSQKRAKELSEIELYGKASSLADNIELKELLKDSKKYLKTLKSLISGQKKEVKNLVGYSKAKMQKEIYDNEIHYKVLNKRMLNREDYYINQFLPTYTLELAEAKEKCEDYYNRALEIIPHNIDVQLSFITDRYEEHKSDEDKLWLYYIALRNRVNEIISELSKTNNPKFKKLIRPI